MAALARITALLSAIWTALVAAFVLSWQGLSLIKTGEWDPFTISRVLDLAAIEYPRVYVIASSPDSEDTSHDMIRWLLDLPASGFLFLVAAILLAFSMWVSSIEKQFAANEERI